MVFGLLEGEINISIENNELKPGETVRGKVRLSLREPKEARELRIELYGETKAMDYEMTEGRRYLVREMISGPRVYRDGEVFNFSITVPKNILDKKSNAVKMHAFTKYWGDKPGHWFVEAVLDIPLSFDIKHRVGVKIKY